MVDTVSPETRSRMMSKIRSKNTKPEMAVRRVLWRAGLRYRVHDRTLPGTPDISNKRKRLAVFVDGCFWHGCPACRSIPQTNADFWRSEIDGNRRRRDKVKKALAANGFAVIEVWEHEANDPEAVLAKMDAGIGGLAT